jgi:pimeloyl-ACP methyl ester carboxylesterase
LQVLDEWRIALGLSGFYLAGHSFGGYLMGTYAALHPLHIKKLILLSPLGIKKRPENFKAKNMFYPEGYGPPNWAAKVIGEKLWGKIVPMNIAKKVASEKLSKKMI